jgi:hypothetical protein
LLQEKTLRTFATAVLFVALSTGAAFADASVAGQWHATLGDNVSINMNVGPSGDWSSQTYQNKAVVREMKGTYTQTKSNDHAGVLVFTPTQADVKEGKVTTETDHYELDHDGDQLKLTSGGDTMVFKKAETH